MAESMKVFVSSTSKDLTDYRAAARKVILDQGWHPIMMEHFGALPDSTVDACLNEGALTLTDVEVDGETVRRAQVTPALCLGCGACVAVCPENAININGMTLKQYEAMVDRIVAESEAA